MKPCIAIMFLSLALYGCETTKNSNKVTVGEDSSLMSILNVHQSPVKWLKVGGVKFEGVVGNDPYYLEISEINGVFFITEDIHANQFAHFVSISGNYSYAIPYEGNIQIGAPDMYRIEAIKASLPIIEIRMRTQYSLYIDKFNLKEMTCVTTRVSL